MEAVPNFITSIGFDTLKYCLNGTQATGLSQVCNLSLKVENYSKNVFQHFAVETSFQL